ncbi:K1C11 protein, partial [Polypterus senegalus]
MLNEKQQMQSLNDRLATYLDKVRTLEATNKDLENKLKNFRTSKVVSRDFTLYQEQLQPLRDQIIAAIIENSRLALKIGNAQLAAEDFRKKYEYLIRQTVEADILNLKSLKEEYDSHQTSNNQEIEALKKEIEEMTKQHGKSVSILKEEMSGTVSVDITTTESPDLKQILDDLRAEYEDIVRSNKQELEMWFNKQVETKQAAAIQETDVSESSKIEVTELHHQHQSLQTEMDTLLVSKGALEDNLAAVNGRYQMELHRYAALVGTMEGELVSIRNSITSQSEDYRSLLNIKEKLEKEIAMYRQLLEGVELGAGGASSAIGFDGGRGFGGGLGVGGRWWRFFSSSSISGVPFMLNEKQQMQSLNDRLATYLDKVRTLEATNKDLENKLKNFHEQSGQQGFHLVPGAAAAPP